MKALIPGSFDPVTNGHVELIRKVAAAFDEVTVGIFINPDKDYFFSEIERFEMLRCAIKDIKNAKAEICSGYVADYCKEHGIGVLAKGVRNAVDYEYEAEMARFNKKRNPDADTVLFFSDDELSGISSSAVRQMHKDGKDVSALVPKCVYRKLQDTNC
jgi:pantetheine-phosphate adenylyltransferase